MWAELRGQRPKGRIANSSQIYVLQGYTLPSSHIFPLLPFCTLALHLFQPSLELWDLQQLLLEKLLLL